MSYNQNVEDSKTAIFEARSEAERIEAANKYFEVVEEELIKEPENGWIDLENPIDALYEAVLNGDKKDWVKAIYEDYTKFVSMCKKLGVAVLELNEDELETVEAYLAK